MNEEYTLADDFFSFCKQVLRFKKEQFFQSSQIELLLRLLALGVGINTDTAADSHARFLSYLLQTLSADIKLKNTLVLSIVQTAALKLEGLNPEELNCD
mmetsp:Transcript_4399/g.7469  ORF Transcript_4399/g.7469 Transcript_4399/m.7469 type:complete len:99 (-) Transcript_4399:571-867(-)